MNDSELIAAVQACDLCSGSLPDAPRPIVQIGLQAPILIAGQAPGRITRERGRPFDDASGERLRRWLGVDQACFYDPACFSILPMGFCYPGSGAGGDAAPRPECAVHWRQRLLAAHSRISLTLVIGRYALDWHLPDSRGQAVSALVGQWRQYWPTRLPLPHPSPRNNRWLAQHPWFEAEVVPVLQARVRSLLAL